MSLNINRGRAAKNVVLLGQDSRMMLWGRKVSVGPPFAGHFAAQAAAVRPYLGSYHRWKADERQDSMRLDDDILPVHGTGWREGE